MNNLNIKLHEGLLDDVDVVSQNVDDTVNIDTINNELAKYSEWEKNQHEPDAKEKYKFFSWLKENQKKINLYVSRASNFGFSTIAADFYDKANPEQMKKILNYHRDESNSSKFEFLIQKLTVYFDQNTKKDMLSFFGHSGIDVLYCNGAVFDTKNINKDTTFEKLKCNGTLLIQDVRNIDGFNVEIYQSNNHSYTYTYPVAIIDSFVPRLNISNTTINFEDFGDATKRILFKTQMVPNLSGLSSNCTSIGFFDEDIFDSNTNPLNNIFDWNYQWTDPKTNKTIAVKSFSVLSKIINSVRGEISTYRKKYTRFVNRPYRVVDDPGKMPTYALPITLKDGVNISKLFNISHLNDLHTIIVTDRDLLVFITKDPKTIKDSHDYKGPRSLKIGFTNDGWTVYVGSDKGKDKSFLDYW